MTFGPTITTIAGMAYLRKQLIDGQHYYYVVKSVRQGDKVISKVLEYLGPVSKVSRDRLKKAMEYWGVKALPKKRKKVSKKAKGKQRRVR